MQLCQALTLAFRSFDVTKSEIRITLLPQSWEKLKGIIWHRQIEIDIFLCISITNNMKSCKKFDEKAHVHRIPKILGVGVFKGKIGYQSRVKFQKKLGVEEPFPKKIHGHNIEFLDPKRIAVTQG